MKSCVSVFQPQVPTPPHRRTKAQTNRCPSQALMSSPDSVTQHNSKTRQGPLASALIEMTCFLPTYTHLKSLPATLADDKLAPSRPSTSEFPGQRASTRQGQAVSETSIHCLLVSHLGPRRSLGAEQYSSSRAP